jgi:branched-chain amino acid transport system substrate-binding protein
VKTKLFVYSIFLLAIVISSFLAWEIALHYFDSDNDAIHIAFVGSLTGEDEANNQSIRQALEMYINLFNKNRNTQQQKIVLDFFDDQNIPDKAYKKAREIVQTNAIAVIGHERSDCSVEGGKIYKKQGILAITPTSSVTEVTRNNDWYFRTFYHNEVQAHFLAKYAKKFLLQQHNTVSIIYVDTIYGNEITKIFEKTSRNMNVDVKYKWKLRNNASEQEIAQTVSDLQKKSNDAGLILLATHSNEGIKLVKQIKDANIKNRLIAPDSYANIQEHFKDYPQEKKTLGYYTDGIYVAAFIVDLFSQSANDFNSRYKEKYQKNLPSAAFYTIDAALLIIEIIRRTKPQGQHESLDSYRKRLRDTLAQINTFEEAIDGFTGYNFFDKDGDISKPISIGIYRNSHLISAPLQLSSDDDDNKYRTVVYTGVQFNEIEQIDINTGRKNMPDFYLWLRFTEKEDGHVIKPQDIEFINAVSPIELKKPIIEETIDGQTYLLYRVKDQLFRENIYSQTEHTFFNIKHILGVNFRHRKSDKDELIYVSDILGISSKTFAQQKHKNKELISLKGWKVDGVNLFQNVTEKTFLGHPKYFVGNTTYSTFNANVQIKRNDLIYHDIIPHRFASHFLIFTTILTLLLFIMASYTKKYLRYLWFIQAIFAFLLLISLEIFLDNVEELELYVSYIHADMETLRVFVLTVFDILWWLIPAILFDVGIKRFLWIPLEEKTERSVPKLIRFVISFIIYSLACFGVIAFVFEQPIASLLATSGLLVGVIGLAVQSNLSNIFSGIALSIERSFRVGDWVKIGSFDEGQVIDMNWRVTNIQTRMQYILSIPNNTVAASDIHNFSYPDNQYWLLCSVYIEPKHDPRQVEKILIRAVLSVKQDVVKGIKPIIMYYNIKEGMVDSFVANYAVFFKTENFQHKYRVLKNVWQSIWVHLSQAGIIPTKPKPYHKKKVEGAATQLGNVLTKDNLQNMIISNYSGLLKNSYFDRFKYPD